MREYIVLWVILLLKILCIIAPLMVVVLYVTWAERKIIGSMQGRIGPHRVGRYGLLQPFADAIKLLHKEIILPSAANRYLFLIAPLLAITPALAAWAVVPFDINLVLANIPAGLLYLLAITSLGAYGMLLAGWASRSQYAFFGAMRSCAQVISYEIALGITFAGVTLASGTMNLHQILVQQSGGLWHWYIWPLFPLFVVYWICGVAETNRAPFDVAEGESELVAGFHVEYSGIGFALFFLAEYANMILISSISAVVFLGGSLSPFQGIPVLDSLFSWIPGIFWFLLKITFFLFLYFWMRATFPRYRYDRIMQLGWKILIPISLIWLIVVAVVVEFYHAA